MKRHFPLNAIRAWWGWVTLCLIVITTLCLSAVSASAAEPVEIKVSGIEGDLLKNVQAALSLPPGLVRNGKVNRRWLQRFQKQLPQKVAPALEPFGYFEAQTSVKLETLGENRFRLLVAVTPAEPVRVSKVKVDIEGPGNNKKELRRLVGEFPLRQGDILRQNQYEAAKGSLKARAIDLGFLDAAFSRHAIRVDRGRREAEIDLLLDTGLQYSFGEVLLHGAPNFPDRFLRRFQAFKPGDVFSHAKLGQTQLNFLDSDRFKDVIVTPLQDQAKDLEVPVSIQLVPSARLRLRPGIGYGTDTGARLPLRYQDVNLFHRGHELQGDLLLAEFRQSLVGSYTIPGSRSLQNYTIFRVGYDREDVDTYESSTLFAETERVHGFGKGRLGSVFLRLLQEDFEIGSEEGSSQMVVPGIRFSRRRYKNPVRPVEGYQFRLETRGAHQTLGSDTGMLQFLASGNALLPLPGRFSVFTRVQGAMTVQNEPLKEFPTSLRFFAGGDQSVRGYGYQSLGPEDENGDVVGGKHQLVGSIELGRAIGQNWGVAAFYDIGNAFNSFSDYELAEGAGIGVRYYTQIGPISVDLARQIGVRDPSIRLHISVGFGW